MQHADLGGDQHLTRVCFACRVQHAAGGQDLDPVLGECAFAGQVQSRSGTTAFGMYIQFGVGMRACLVGQLVTVDSGVHVALAGPDVQVLAAGDAPHVRAEELVGAEQHLAVLGNRRHDLDGVRRRAADVGLGLHRGRGVDVGNDDGAGMLGLPGSQLVGGDRVGQRAARPLIGNQHGLVRAENLGGLGHEMHAAEHDRVLRCLGGDSRQRQRVTDVVGDVLDGRQLVVVRQQRCAAQICQSTDLGGPFLVTVDAGITGRTRDNSVRQIVSGHAVKNRHCRLLTPVEVFDL